MESDQMKELIKDIIKLDKDTQEEIILLQKEKDKVYDEITKLKEDLTNKNIQDEKKQLEELNLKYEKEYEEYKKKLKQLNEERKKEIESLYNDKKIEWLNDLYNYCLKD